MKLKFSIQKHALSWSVPVEASYKVNQVQFLNYAPSISQPETWITVKVGSHNESIVFNVGTPVDPDGDHVWVSAWDIINEQGETVVLDWISLVDSASIAIDGVNFSFSPKKNLTDQLLEIRYEISDDNQADPKSAKYSFFVTVINACNTKQKNGINCDQPLDVKQGTKKEQSNQLNYFDEVNETEVETLIPIWYEDEYRKRPEYASATIIEVIPVQPDWLGLFEIQFSEFVRLPSSLLDLSSSNQEEGLISIHYQASTTNLDYLYDIEEEINEMTWSV